MLIGSSAGPLNENAEVGSRNIPRHPFALVPWGREVLPRGRALNFRCLVQLNVADHRSSDRERRNLAEIGLQGLSCLRSVRTLTEDAPAQWRHGGTSSI